MSWAREMQLALALRAVCDAETPPARLRAVQAGRALADEVLNADGPPAPPDDRDHPRGGEPGRGPGRGCLLTLFVILIPFALVALGYFAAGHP